MSKLGSATSFAAEAALWVAGAAIIAGAAGAHWSVEIPADMNPLAGSTASPSANPSASASPTLALETLAPGASPTASPIAIKYQAYVARADYQIVAKAIGVESGSINGTQFELRLTGTMSYQNGNHASYTRVTNDGTVNTDDEIAVGAFNYVSINGGEWTKKDRPASDAISDRLTVAPVAIFLDRGIETKNGLQLHRLDIADPVAYSKAGIEASNPKLTDAQLTYTVWVDDNGVPAAIHIEGWQVGPVNGVSTRLTIVDDIRIIATSGVTITAPI